MQTLSLWVPRREFIQALSALSTVRRRRFASVLPVWLRFDGRERLLWIEEQSAAASGAVAAEGSWPAMGATVDLYLLRRAATLISAETAQLAATADAVVVPTDRGYVRLKLLSFGPESRRPLPPQPPAAPPDPLANLPLLKWARDRGT